jgi:hypothetical protein
MTRLNVIRAILFLMAFVPISLFGQNIRIADLSMNRIGDSGRSFPAIAATVSRFDVVAADEVRDLGGMEKVLAGMDDDWEADLSRGGFFGFFYNNRVQLIKELGTYPETVQFARPPYGAQFRFSGTRFAFNVVVCHIEAEGDQKTRMAEIAHLAAVHRYFERLTGNRGITILLAGGLGDDPEQAVRLLMAVTRGEVLAVKTNLTGTKGSHDGDEGMFASAALRPRIEEAGIGDSMPHPAYVILRIGS